MDCFCIQCLGWVSTSQIYIWIAGDLHIKHKGQVLLLEACDPILFSSHVSHYLLSCNTLLYARMLLHCYFTCWEEDKAFQTAGGAVAQGMSHQAVTLVRTAKLSHSECRQCPNSIRVQSACQGKAGFSHQDWSSDKSQGIITLPFCQWPVRETLAITTLLLTQCENNTETFNTERK